MAVTVQTPSAATEFAGREALRAHSAEFRKAVFEVAQGIYVAVGYAFVINGCSVGGDAQVEHGLTREPLKVVEA